MKSKSKKREAEKAKVEIRIEDLEKEIKELDLAMADSSLDYEELNKLFLRKDELNKELESVMELWFSLNNQF